LSSSILKVFINGCLRLNGFSANEDEELALESSPRGIFPDLVEEMEVMASSATPTEVGEVLDNRLKIATLCSIVTGMSTQLSDNYIPPVIKGVERLLDQMKRYQREQASVEATEDSENVAPSFGDGTTTPSRLRVVQPQPRLYSTRKKKLPSTNALSKPSVAEINSIKDTFLGRDALVVRSGSDHTYN